MLVVDGTRRAGEVEDAIDLDVQGECHVMAHQLEPRMPHQLDDVALVACEKIVDAQGIVTALDQTVAQVRTEEASPAGDQYP